jgi:hypothetical protein
MGQVRQLMFLVFIIPIELCFGLRGNRPQPAPCVDSWVARHAWTACNRQYVVQEIDFDNDKTKNLIKFNFYKRVQSF